MLRTEHHNRYTIIGLLAGSLFLYFSKLRSLTTIFGVKTIFGFSRASFFNVFSAYQYQNLILFQMVNTKYAARRQTGTLIELIERTE